MFRRTIQTRKERQASSGGSKQFLRGLIKVVNDCVRLSSSDNIPPETLTFCIRRLEALERSLIHAKGSILTEDNGQALLIQVQELLTEFRNGTECSQERTSYTVPRERGERGGAPRVIITKEQLQFLQSCNFTVKRIAQLIGVSRMTIMRNISKFNLSVQFSTMTDEELDQLIDTLIRGNKKIGPNAVKALLFSMGHRVQRRRVRSSMLRVDPGGSALRTAVPLRRRTYRVAGPNSVWHIDGNHKLIRWRFIVHGAIDGYSRLFVFLQASDNNRQETVLGAFVRATDTYNVPSRICVDSGAENNSVCRVMEMVRGESRGSAIRCRSVHNQRIERAWVHV